MRKTSDHPVFCVLITVQRDGDLYYAQCPQIGRIHVCGESIDEAREAADDAFVAYLEMSLRNGDPIPPGILADQTRPNAAEQNRLEQKQTRTTRTFVEEVGLAFA